MHKPTYLTTSFNAARQAGLIGFFFSFFFPFLFRYLYTDLDKKRVRFSCHLVTVSCGKRLKPYNEDIISGGRGRLRVEVKGCLGVFLTLLYFTCFARIEK